MKSSQSFSFQSSFASSVPNSQWLPGSVSRATTELILRIARAQHGLTSRKQLLAAGLPSRTIDGRMRSGWLRPVFPGVYAVGREVTSEEGVWMAGILASGSGGVLARQSAGALWGFFDWNGPVTVVRAESRIRPSEMLTRPGLSKPRSLEVRRSRHLEPSEATVYLGFPVTTAARTLFDLAGGLDDKQFTAAFNEADRLGLLEETSLRAYVSRGRGCRGAARFRRQFLLRHPDTKDTLSEMESIFLELCREAGLPSPRVNRNSGSYKIDCLWVEQLLVVELDSYEFHRGKMAFNRDATRDLDMKLSGYQVLRFTYSMLVNRPIDVINLVHRELRPDSQPVPGSIRTEMG